MKTAALIVAIVGTALAVLVWCSPRADAQRSRGWDDRYLNIAERTIFPGPTFTFARVRYGSAGFRRGGAWATDYPDSDVNFSQRLSELTTIKVLRDERGEFQHVVVDLTDDALFNYPFIYMIEVGALSFTEDEIVRLREYLFRGGFLMVDDFWGSYEWENWEYEITRVFPPDKFPECQMRDIPLSHPIFNIVFPVTEKPQVPSIHHWQATGNTSERGYDSATPRYLGIHDKNGRLMVIVCHNTDLGDGWEREAWSEEYFREFSVKKSYPMGINIVVYAMTH